MSVAGHSSVAKTALFDGSAPSLTSSKTEQEEVTIFRPGGIYVLRGTMDEVSSLQALRRSHQLRAGRLLDWSASFLRSLMMGGPRCLS